MRHPWIGVLTWTWLSVMNPHAYTWAAAKMPVAAMVAGSTLIGLVVTRDPRRIFVTPESAFLVLFMLWIAITFPFSFSVDGSYEMLSTVMKIDLMILVTLVLLQSRRQIELFVWVVVLSLGFYGVKGGIFTILSGGDAAGLGPGRVHRRQQRDRAGAGDRDPVDALPSVGSAATVEEVGLDRRHASDRDCRAWQPIARGSAGDRVPWDFFCGSRARTRS